ncbi:MULTISPECIES: hypothetical protein [unclassified Microcoleus]|uniref:hypothetical protein n=1 Tax=unclassified Microcoleus TaxID=2642155 RepID=UPI0025F39683|nr:MULTISPECIES: hypothetical protein [unclassified Microcoleus]
MSLWFDFLSIQALCSPCKETGFFADFRAATEYFGEKTRFLAVGAIANYLIIFFHIKKIATVKFFCRDRLFS